jgi:hypothetical protein
MLQSSLDKGKNREYRQEQNNNDIDSFKQSEKGPEGEMLLMIIFCVG